MTDKKPVSDYDKQVELLKKLMCPHCGSTNTVHVKTSYKQWCRKCGYEWQVK